MILLEGFFYALVKFDKSVLDCLLKVNDDKSRVFKERLDFFWCGCVIVSNFAVVESCMAMGG
jgi:hypothetical protein